MESLSLDLLVKVLHFAVEDVHDARPTIKIKKEEELTAVSSRAPPPDLLSELR